MNSAHRLQESAVACLSNLLQVTARLMVFETL
jgi:hypothetical protein